MKPSLNASRLVLVLIASCLPAVHAQTVTWDGDAADGLWETATNWDGDAVPGAGDEVFISNGDAVTGIQFNTTVELTLSGGSSLGDPGVWRAIGATVTVEAGSTLGSGGFWDLDDGTFTFKDGAAVNMGHWEQKDTNVFNFELSASGFTALTPGTFRIGNGGLTADIANATYNVDMAAYTGGPGTIVLADFASDAYGMDDATFQGAGGLNVLNPGSYTASIQWNDATEAIELVVSGGAVPPVTWDGGGTGDSWTTAENWDPDGVPGATDEVLVGAGASVADAPNSFGSLEIAAGATVTFPGQFLDGNKTLEVAGTLDGGGVLRFGATMELSGSLGAGITFLDTNNGTINFVDGASFANANLPFEHKGTNSFGYKLSTTGFATISAGQLLSGAGAVWSDVTYNIDISDYDDANGTTIVLADYSGHAAAYDGPFDPTVNIEAGSSGLNATLSFDTTDSRLVLSIAGAPQTTVDVFILAGQSNANGQGLVSELTVPQSTQDALFYNSWHLQAFNAESTQYYSGWLPQTVAGETRSTGNVSSTFGSSPWFGPEMGFVSRANEINLSPNAMAVLKYAVDGSALTANVNFSDWDLTASAPNDGDCWRGFQAALADAVAGLQSSGYTPHFKGMIWWQGENGTSVAGLNAFIAEVRSHLASNYGLQNAAAFPVVITGNDFWGAGLETGVADADDHVGFIDSVVYGQTGGYTNVHPGSGQSGNPTDVTGNGINDMWDFGVAYADQMALAIAGNTGPPTGTADATWDGGGTGDSWTTAENWDPDGVPGATDDVLVGAGASVADAPNSFGSLEIAAGATVTFPGQFLDGSKTLEVAGTLDGGGVLRFGATMELSGSLGAGITFLDTNNGTINFVDGASFANANLPFEHKGTNSFGYKLSTTGFTTISAGQLFSGAGAVWSDVTYNIDISDYDHSNGTTIVLADYSGHAAAYNATFDPTVNIIAGASGLGAVLSFDTLSSQLILSIDPPGNDAPVAADLTYATNGVDPLVITLSATDIEGDTLTYSVESGPGAGMLTGTAPNLTYTYTGSDFEPDSFTYKANDGAADSNIATVSIIPVPQSTTDLWGSLQSAIENEALNAGTHTTWTEPHADGSGSTITISRVTYDLGTLVGTQHTASPVIAAYYARPTGGTNLPGLVQNHGGGQRALSYIAKFWAEQGYAAICINWGGLHLQSANPNEPAPAPGQIHPNTNWDGLAGGFTRVSTPSEPLEHPVTEAIFKSDVDPAVYSDGQTLHNIPHPLNSSWTLNGYAARRAITFLQSQSEVDGSKIGVLGWSMGGRTTMMSSTDPRITVLGPAVGGSGFLFEDWWGLPGTARHSSGWQDYELFKNTVDDQSYWPVVSAPVLFLNGSNDFNAPFDLVTKSMSLHEVGLNDVSPDNILATSPHYNHRVTDPTLASRIHWMRHHLKGDVEFPEISNSELEMTTPDGIPVFKVYPDTSTSLSIASVDIVYGTDRDSRTRFWRDAAAVDMGTHWEAKLPVFDINEPLVVHAIITYDIGFTQLMPAGSAPTSLFSVASKVHTYYPTGVDTTGYTFPAELDTAVHQIHVLSSADLIGNGLRETAEVSDAIDDPSSARGYKDWFLINGGNSVLWQWYTRKTNDPCFRGGQGAQLTFDLTADAVNTLVVKIVVDGWNENAQTRYIASVPIAVGLNQVSLSVADFKRDDNTPLDSWSRAKFMGFGSGQAFNLNGNGWAGAIPTLADLAWSGGVTILDEGVPTSWLASFGLPLSNDAVVQDTDGDGFLTWEEFVAGTVPTDPSSLFKVTGSQASATEMTLEWPAVAGRVYELWSSLSLVEGSWVLEDGDLPYVVPAGSTTVGVGPGSRFFRIGVRMVSQ